MQTRAVVFTGVDQVEVRDVDVPSPEAGEVLVRLKSSVISPGTELRCLKGTQRGLPDEPFVPGYAGAGEVVEAGAGAESWLGKRVFMRAGLRASVALFWGGHVGHGVVRPETLIELPEAVDLISAPLCRLFAIAHRGVALSRPATGSIVGVVGLGVIGQCSARLFHAAGCQVIGVDPIAERVDALRKVGIEAARVEGSASQALLESYSSGVDILVDATGSERVLNEAMGALKRKAWNDAVSPSGQVVVQGSYADRFELDYTAFFLPETTMHFPRDTTDVDMALVLGQMAYGRVSYRDLISWSGPPDEAGSVYRRLANREPGLLTGAFLWS